MKIRFIGSGLLAIAAMNARADENLPQPHRRNSKATYYKAVEVDFGTESGKPLDLKFKRCLVEQSDLLDATMSSIAEKPYSVGTGVDLDKIHIVFNDTKVWGIPSATWDVKKFPREITLHVQSRTLWPLDPKTKSQCATLSTEQIRTALADHSAARISHVRATRYPKSWQNEHSYQTIDGPVSQQDYEVMKHMHGFE